MGFENRNYGRCIQTEQPQQHQVVADRKRGFSKLEIMERAPELNNNSNDWTKYRELNMEVTEGGSKAGQEAEFLLKLSNAVV